MIPRKELLLLCSASIAALVATARMLPRSASTHPTAPLVGNLTSSKPFASDDSLGDASATIAANDPFRLANVPAEVRYDARVENAMGGAVQPPAIRPTFAVRAIMGGPPWQAILDGIPGQPAGTIVRQGLTFDKINIKAVGRDTVVVQAPDTTWKLTLARTHD